MGNIGRTVAKLLKLLVAKFSIIQQVENTKQDYLSVDRNIIKTSDIVSIHCPLNEQTKGLIGEESFKLMKKEAILINVGRGIVDEEALVEVYKNTKLPGQDSMFLKENHLQKKVLYYKLMMLQNF